jgi:plastocyanin
MIARLMAVAAVVAVFGAGGVACGSDADSKPEAIEASVDGAADHEFVIPLGSARRADKGEHLFIFPSKLVVKVGETIRIVNEDDRMQIVGPFSVGPGQTLTQRFSSPGTFIGVCTTHPDSEFTIVVES